MNNKEFQNIRVSKNTKELLRQKGQKGETYEQIILKLIRSD